MILILILYIQFGLSYVKPDQTDNKHLLLLLLLLSRTTP
jgi:hypothetical protein